MKLTKLMLSAFAAAVALVACNKVETDPVPQSTSMKSVKISLENVIMTKGEAGDKIKAGDAIQVNNFKLFLTDFTEAFLFILILNNSSVNKYSFASYKRSPMEFCGRPMISAAIPDLKQNPSPTEHADTKYGNTAGI